MAYTDNKCMRLRTLIVILLPRASTLRPRNSLPSPIISCISSFLEKICPKYSGIKKCHQISRERQKKVNKELIPEVMEEDSHHPYEQYPTTCLPSRENSPTHSTSSLDGNNGPEAPDEYIGGSYSMRSITLQHSAILFCCCFITHVTVQ